MRRALFARKIFASEGRDQRREFAVAETGSVCVVESEGNGRMCLSLPEVLISLIGIEKVIPTFPDLEVFLTVAAPFRYRGAHESLQLDLDRVSHGRDGPARVSRCAARQRQNQRTGR